MKGIYSLCLILFISFGGYVQTFQSREGFLSLDDILKIQQTDLTKVTDFFRLKKWEFYGSTSDDEYEDSYYNDVFKKVQWSYKVNYYENDEDKAMGWATFYYKEGFPNTFSYLTHSSEDFNKILDEAKLKLKLISTDVPASNELITMFKTSKGLDVEFKISKNLEERGRYYRTVTVSNEKVLKLKLEQYYTQLAIEEEKEYKIRLELALQEFIDAFKTNRKDKIAGVISFPYDMSPLNPIQNEQEMIKHFDEVFTDSVIKLFANSTISEWKEVASGRFNHDNIPVLVDNYYAGSERYYEGLRISKIYIETPQFIQEKEKVIQREKKTLHESIQKFSTPLKVFNTPDYRYRIDEVGEDLRLSIWNSTQLWNEKPKLIVHEGIWEYDETTNEINVFYFKTNEKVYLFHYYSTLVIKDVNKLLEINSNYFADVNSILYGNDDGEYEYAIISSEDINALSREDILDEVFKIEQLKIHMAFVETGNINFQNGKLSQAKKDYENALKVKYDKAVAGKLKETNDEILRVTNLKKQLTQQHDLVMQNHALKTDDDLLLKLPEIKKNYGEIYKQCIDQINKTLNDEWFIIDSVYNEKLKVFQESEIWSKEEENQVGELKAFSEKVLFNDKFNNQIKLLVAAEDKKGLKILKEKDISIIIETIMSL